MSMPPVVKACVIPTDVADAVAWLDTVDPSVDLPEIRLNAIRRGPWAREPVVPIEVERRTGAAKSEVGQ